VDIARANPKSQSYNIFIRKGKKSHIRPFSNVLICRKFELASHGLKKAFIYSFQRQIFEKKQQIFTLKKLSQTCTKCRQGGKCVIGMMCRTIE